MIVEIKENQLPNDDWNSIQIDESIIIRCLGELPVLFNSIQAWVVRGNPQRGNFEVCLMLKDENSVNYNITK